LRNSRSEALSDRRGGPLLSSPCQRTDRSADKVRTRSTPVLWRFVCVRRSTLHSGGLTFGSGTLQRLGDLTDLFAQHLAVDVRATVGSDWHALIQTWAARHVFTHCDGVVDAKYLDTVPGSTQR